MARSYFNDLYAFICVAREGNFTRAAAQLDVSQSALSHTIRNLEQRMGVRLLTRTTRSVTPTEAGEHLLNTVGIHFEGIQHEIDILGEYRDKPAGKLRINTSKHAANTILLPKLKPMMVEYPDIHVELVIDNALRDIVSERFDAGVRLGEHLADGMIAMRIGPDLRLIVVGSPEYFDNHPVPHTPHDLMEHQCINLRLSTHGNLYHWEFSLDGQDIKVRVEGNLVLNDSAQIIDAAINGYGLAMVMEDSAQRYIDSGQLKPVLQD